MTMHEAFAVDTVLRYWLEMDDRYGDPISDEQVIDAMALLADQIHTRLQTVSGDQIRARWRALEAGRG